MKDNDIKAILDEFANALQRDGKTKNAIASRKRDLKVALLHFKNKKEFEETISNNSKFANFINDLKQTVPQDRISDIKNAISCYAKLCLSISIFTKPDEIKKALQKYSEAVQLFDSFGEFDTVNIVGEYGEYYICHRFKLNRAFTNKKAYDATFIENGVEKKVQIKTRWYRGNNLNNENIEFGSIKPAEIDYFVGVIFNVDFTDATIIVMNKDGINDYFNHYKITKKVIRYNRQFDLTKFAINRLNGKQI